MCKATVWDFNSSQWHTWDTWVCVESAQNMNLNNFFALSHHYIKLHILVLGRALFLWKNSICFLFLQLLSSILPWNWWLFKNANLIFVWYGACFILFCSLSGWISNHVVGNPTTAQYSSEHPPSSCSSTEISMASLTTSNITIIIIATTSDPSSYF